MSVSERKSKCVALVDGDLVPRGAEHHPCHQQLVLHDVGLAWLELPHTVVTGGALISRTSFGWADTDVPIGILTAAQCEHFLLRSHRADVVGKVRPGKPEESAPTEVGVLLGMEAVTFAGRAMPVEFMITVCSVEIWHHEAAAIVGRTVLRRWLACPATPLVLGTAVFCLDRGARAEAQVALMLPDVGVWTLPPRPLQQLRSHV